MPSEAALEILAISDSAVFEHALNAVGLTILGQDDSDPLRNSVQNEHVDAIASVLTEDAHDLVELPSDIQAIKQLAEDYGYIVGVLSEKELTSQARKQLPSSSFVFPDKRKYPIHDKAHARNALSRVSAHGTPEEKKKVRAAVHRKFPGIGEDDED